MSKRRTIGTWIYKNGGGKEIQRKLESQLKEREIDVISGLNLRKAEAHGNHIYCKDVKMDQLDAFFSYNAGEQSLYQLYLYEQLDRYIPTINNYQAFKLTEDKFQTNQLLRRHGINTPEFFLCHRDDSKQLKRIFKKWNDTFVFKPVDGWGGVGMALIENKQSLDMLMPFLNQMDLRFFYVEKFIDYDGSDYRIDIVDGEFIACYGRQARAGDWRTNVTSGGSVILREPNDALVEVAKHAAAVTGLEIAGVDIIYDRAKEEYVVLEVNGIPAFATPEQEKLGLDFNDRKIEAIVNLIDRITNV